MSPIDRAYVRLAASIVNSGIAANDKKFLESKWCAARRY